jgi:hypothetical protein
MSNIDKWISDFRGTNGLQTDAVRREAENDLARQKRQKLDEPKDYEKRMRAQSAKSAKLRELRLAKEAAERADAAARKAAPKSRVRVSPTEA